MEVEKCNFGYYGFGVKGFVLLMIEIVIEVIEECVFVIVIFELMEVGCEMLNYLIDLLFYVVEVVVYCVENYCVLLIIKGDFLD